MRRITLDYRDSATFAVVESEGYRGTRSVTEQHSVQGIFIQSLNLSSLGYQENIDADAVLFPDPDDAFIVENYYRLTGMYVLMSLFESPESISWYKITSTTVNRDHLLDNKIYNVECLLKKSEEIPGVS